MQSRLGSASLDKHLNGLLMLLSFTVGHSAGEAIEVRPIHIRMGAHLDGGAREVSGPRVAGFVPQME